MKSNRLHLIIYAAALGVLAGCASGRKAGKSVTVSPAPYVLTPDSNGCMDMDMSFRVPSRYFSRRSRLIILPQLMVGDTVRDEYRPVVLDAPIYSKKKERQEKLEGYVDPYSGRSVALDRVTRSFEWPYRETVRVPEGMGEARIVGVVTSDGCGECTGVDTIDIATVTSPATLIDVKRSLDLTWMEPAYVIRPKIRHGKGVAHLQFVINKYDIRLSMGNNRKELEDMVQALAPVLNDTLATLTSLDIYGMASADGPLSFNTPLSRNRAESAKRWLVNRLGIPAEVQRIITVGSRPEGWQPVLDAMTADGHPDAVAVKAILEKYAHENDDVAERHIRRLACWPDIRAKYLQKDRKVEYAYTYTIRSFTTDEELLEMYDKCPENFNEEELLRVATLAETPADKKQVYRTILDYFPQSQVAANNLAVLWLREGDDGQARRVLDGLEQYSEEALSTLEASYVYANDYERAIELLKDVDLPVGRYNLGLMKARQRKLEEAYELLRPFGDTNSALAALGVNKNEEAKRMIEAVDDDSPTTEYARAIVAARLREHAAFYKHISAACKDGALRRRAATEPDFRPYGEEERFRALLNGTKEEAR